MGSPLGFRGILGRGRIEFALQVPIEEPVDGEGRHSASSSTVASPVRGTRASVFRRRPLAAWATSAERQKLATPLVIGHHRGGWSVASSDERSTLNSRGLLMVVSTRNTVAWS